MQIESYKLYSNYLGWHSTLQWPKSKNSCLQKTIQHTPDPEGLQKKTKQKNKQNSWTIYKMTKRFTNISPQFVEKLLDRIFAMKVMWHEGER